MNFNNKIGDKYEKVCLILVKKFVCIYILSLQKFKNIR